MSALQHSEEHRVTALARGFREELSHVAESPLWSMTSDEASDALVLLTQVRTQLDALLMRVAARLDRRRWLWRRRDSDELVGQRNAYDAGRGPPDG